MNNKFIKNKKLIFISSFIASILVISFASCTFYSPARAAGPSEAGGAAVITYLEMDPRDHRIIYAGTRDGLFKTENSGVNWELSLKHLIVWDIEAFGNVVYTATNQGIYKSTNGGESWDLMPEKIGKLSLLTFSAVDPDIVYVSNRETIFKSTDGATTWQTLERNLPSNVFQILELEANSGNPQIVYAKAKLAELKWEDVYEEIGEVILKTVDGGENWSETEEFEFERSDLVIDPTNPIIQYKATFTGVARSEDGGKTWENTGWVVQSATSLIVDPIDPDTIYVGTEGNGVWRSVDRGVHWDEAGLEGAIVYALDIATEERGGLIFAAAATNKGLYKDHKRIEPILWDLSWAFDEPASCLSIDPKDSNIIYAGAGEKGLVKSLNEGDTWFSLTEEPWITLPDGKIEYDPNALTAVWVRYITIDLSDSDVVYVITNENGGIFKSINGGEDWQRISAGLEESYANSLVIAPDNSDELYLGIWEIKGGKITGVYKSTDGGKTWEGPSLRYMKIRTLKINPSTTPYTIYAGTYGQGAYKSADKGATWVPLDEDLILKEISVNAIAITPFAFTTTLHPLENLIKPVFDAPQEKSLVYLATDEGIHWYEVLAEEVFEKEGKFTPFQYFVIILSLILILGLIGWWIYRKRKRKIM